MRPEGVAKAGYYPTASRSPATARTKRTALFVSQVFDPEAADEEARRSGLWADTLLESDGRRVLAKGRTYKESIPIESDDPAVEIEREVLRTSVVALDLRSGRFEVIEH